MAMAAGCVRLAAWQLDRAAESRALVERFDAAAALPELELPVADVGAARYRRLGLSGRYVAAPQVLLDNRVRDGVAGYEVLTAFDADRGQLVLVNRGWVRAPARRDELPDVAVGTDASSIAGRVGALPRAGLDLGNGVPGPGPHLYVMSYPELAELEPFFAGGLEPFVLLLDGSAPGALDTDWRPPGDRSMRNVVYAGQWALFAIMAGGAAAGLLAGPAWKRRRAQRDKAG
jgi:cytochrome oxidase assembly protein ShyY1